MRLRASAHHRLPRVDKPPKKEGLSGHRPCVPYLCSQVRLASRIRFPLPRSQGLDDPILTRWAWRPHKPYAFDYFLIPSTNLAYRSRQGSEQPPFRLRCRPGVQRLRARARCRCLPSLTALLLPCRRRLRSPLGVPLCRRLERSAVHTCALTARSRLLYHT